MWVALDAMTDQATMEKMSKTMMIAFPSGVAVIQMRHNSDSAKKYGTCMKMSDQASRSVELTFSGSPNGQNVSAVLKVQKPARSNNKNI